MLKGEITSTASKIADYHNNYKCSKPFIICVNNNCGVTYDKTICVGDLFYAEYIKTSTSSVQKFLEEVQVSYDRLMHYFEDTEFDDINGLYEWLYNLETIPDMWGLSPNPILKTRLISDLDLPNLYAHEYSIIDSDQMSHLLSKGIYDFIEVSKKHDQEKPDTKTGFTFTDEEQRDIYGAALIDGALMGDAWALASGINIKPDIVAVLNGFFRLKHEYLGILTPTTIKYKKMETTK